MAIFHERDNKGVKIEIPSAKFVLKKSLVTPKEGWEDSIIHIFQLGEGGFTPRHQHPQMFLL